MFIVIILHLVILLLVYIHSDNNIIVINLFIKSYWLSNSIHIDVDNVASFNYNDIHIEFGKLIMYMIMKIN